MSTTYVFNDIRQMRTVCGINDKNISYMEKLLGVNISLRGNEAFYSSSGNIVSRMFDSLVKLTSITDEISENEILIEYKNIINSGFPEKGHNENEENSSEHRIITIGTKTICAKGYTQSRYIKSMTNSQIIFATGPAGTGKTFLAVSYCLGELFSGRKQKIIITRPVVEAGESLGFLPGDLSQKLNPYLKPIYDSMEATISPSTVEKLEESGAIETAPLAYMRGRSIHNACIILDEAQNTTSGQMKMFLTRLGENSQAIITGDLTQTDLPSGRESGLSQALRILKGIEGISFVEFSSGDTVRSRVVQRIVDAYEKN